MGLRRRTCTTSAGRGRPGPSRAGRTRSSVVAAPAFGPAGSSTRPAGRQLPAHVRLVSSGSGRRRVPARAARNRTRRENPRGCGKCRHRRRVRCGATFLRFVVVDGVQLGPVLEARTWCCHVWESASSRTTGRAFRRPVSEKRAVRAAAGIRCLHDAMAAGAEDARPADSSHVRSARTTCSSLAGSVNSIHSRAKSSETSRSRGADRGDRPTEPEGLCDLAPGKSTRGRVRPEQARRARSVYRPLEAGAIVPTDRGAMW